MWIDVNEKLPDSRKVVFCTSEPDVYMGFYLVELELWIYGDGASFEKSDVTHWMPIPVL